MSIVRTGLQLVALFGAGMSLGFGLQAAGFVPGQAVPQAPAAANSAPPATDSLTTGSTATTAPAATTVVRLEGDGDPARDGMRRGVILTVRSALALPCDGDRRAAAQVMVRHYARAWAMAPKTAGARAGFMTPLDDESVRAIAAATRAGILPMAVAATWPSPEGEGLAEIQAQARVAATETDRPTCADGVRAGRASLPL